jgi:transposase
MSSMEVPRGPDGAPVLSPEIWAATPVAAQALISSLVAVAGQVTRLEARVRELEARLGQNSSNSSRPPSSDPPSAPRRSPPPRGPNGRTRGGQPGHEAHYRTLAPPERIDQVVDHWPVGCGGCATSFSGGVVSSGLFSSGVALDYVPHQVTELPPVRAHVTEHRLHRLVCPACGSATRATLPPAVPRGAFGPRLQGTLALLSGRYRWSRREVVDVCETLLDVPIALGSVDHLCQVPADALAHPIAEAMALHPQTDVGYADEAPWRQAGKCGWLWTVVTPLVTIFQVATARSSAIIKGLLGEDFAGVLVSDRYAGYSWLDVASR